MYIKTERKEKYNDSSWNSRARRSIDMTLNSMLVILTENQDPVLGLNYTNTTDKEGQNHYVITTLPFHVNKPTYAYPPIITFITQP